VPVLAESKNIPSDNLAILFTGHLKKSELLLVFSSLIANAADSKFTVVIAHKSFIVGIFLTAKVLPDKAVQVIEKAPLA
jgi:hypothetical protein